MKRFEPSEYSHSPTALAKPNTADPKPSPILGLGLTAGGLALLGGILIVPAFVINPWIVKQFKPEWPYGKRLATSMVVGMGLSMVAGIARAAVTRPAAPATKSDATTTA